MPQIPGIPAEAITIQELAIAIGKSETVVRYWIERENIRRWQAPDRRIYLLLADWLAATNGRISREVRELGEPPRSA